MARKARLPLAAGIVAAVLLAVLPVHLWIETSGSWEQPYAALALLGLLWCFISLHEARWQSWRAAALVGAFLGAAALLSASLVAAGACMFAASWWSAPGARKRVLTRGLLLASMSALVISPWAVRNYRELGGFIPLRSNFGLELAVGNNDNANGIGYDPSWEDSARADSPMHPFRNSEERARLRSMGERAYMEAKQREGMAWIRTHPRRFATLTARRFVLFWFPTPDLWTAPTPLRGFKAAISAAIGAGALLGLGRALRLAAPLPLVLPGRAVRHLGGLLHPSCGSAVPISDHRSFDPARRVGGIACGRMDPGKDPMGVKRHLHLLPLLGIIPSFLLAAYSLTQPWARGRFMLVLGISRSPGAALLVVMMLAGMVAVSVTAAARFRYLTLAGAVHLAMGALMGGVSWIAFRMVRHAGVKLLGFVPLTSIHPADGLWLFLAASFMVMVLGLVEIAVSQERRRRRERTRGPRPT